MRIPFSDIEENNATTCIRYFPPISEELQVNDVTQPRKHILSKIQIVILNEVDVSV